MNYETTTMEIEIKFRGYSEDMQCFVYGFYQEVEACNIRQGYIFWQGHVTPILINSVGQFIGQRDKNKKEIYCGDILEFKDEFNRAYKFVVESGLFKREVKGFEEINECEIAGFCFRSLTTKRATFPIINNYLGKHDLDILEVIGNITENPELLIN